MTKVTVSKANTYSGHRDCVYALEGTDSNNLFTSGGDGMVVQWDLDQPDRGEMLAQVPTSVYDIKYLKERSLLVVGQNFEGLQLLDIDKREITTSLKIEDAIFFIEAHNDHMIVGSKSGMVHIIGLDPLIPVKRLDYSKSSARCIALCKQRNEFAIGYSDHRIRIFALDDFSLKNEIKAHENSVFTLQYAPGGEYLISGSRDAHLKVWDSNNYELHESIVAHMYAINSLVFSPNGKHFVTCSMDKSIKVWDYANLKLLKVIDKSRHAGHGTSVNKLFWSPYNQQIISCSDDRTISLWDIEFS